MSEICRGDLLVSTAEWEKAKALLYEVYRKTWIEAYYDPTNAQSQEFAKPIADLMIEVNKILKLRE